MQANQVYAVRVPHGEPFQLRDLPVGVLADIAERNSVSWLIALDAPLSNMSVALDLLKAVAELNGFAVPTPMRVRDLVTLCAESFVLVEKDEAEETESADDAIAWSA